MWCLMFLAAVVERVSLECVGKAALQWSTIVMGTLKVKLTLNSGPFDYYIFVKSI